jgi:hypothetical protein
MDLSPDKFYKGSYNFRRCANGPMETVPRYSYETKSTLFDVFHIDGDRYYKINGYQVTNSHNPIFSAIIKHFNLEE